MRSIVVAALLTLSLDAAALSGTRQQQSSSSNPPPAGVVNVNTATVEQVAYLPGVGPKTAQATVAGRPYATVEALDAVKGIGLVKLTKMRAYVVLTGQTTATSKIKIARAGGAK